MADWNEQAAPNNNLASADMRRGRKRIVPTEHEFSEELSDGGERDQFIKEQQQGFKK